MARHTHRSRQGFAGLIFYIQIQRDLNSNYRREKRPVRRNESNTWASLVVGSVQTLGDQAETFSVSTTAIQTPSANP